MRAPDWRRLGLALGSLTIVAWLPNLAQADLPAEGVTISVEAPSTCPGNEAVRAMLVDLLGPSVNTGEPLFAKLTIRSTPSGFELELETQTASGREVRRLESASCVTLAETAALLVAIVHDPSVDVSRAISERPVDQTPPELAPLVAEPPLDPRPVVVEPPPPVLPPLEPISPLGFVAAVGVGLGALDLPGAHPMIGATVGLRVEDYRVEGAFEASFGARATLPSTDDKGANFAFFYGALSGCRAIVPWRVAWPRAVESVDLGACVGVEVGSMTGEGFGVESPASGTALWVAPRADARLGFSLFDGPLSLFGRVGLAVPIDPRRFVFEGQTAAGTVTLVHEVAPVAFRGFIGSELQL